MNTFYTLTLGCKINQYETQAIIEALLVQGRTPVNDPAEAGLILVNSCAVTATAVSDLRQAVRRLHRANPRAEILVTGCAAQILGQELASLPGVVRVLPQERKAELLGCEPATHGWQPFAISDYGRARPVLKVQDGCSHHCTYCVVPLARGRSVSREPEEVLEEAERLLVAGFRELILSGVNLRQYGADLPGTPDFWDLLALLDRELAPRWAEWARLRLSSLEPGQLGDKALETLAGSRMVCPHLHLSLQSGDPEVLKRMGRGHYRPEQALEFAGRLKAAWPVFGLGADLLVGFPGESAAQFENTLSLARDLPLSYAHVFPYSPRPGTAAAAMSGHVSQEEKKARAARLRAVTTAKKRAFLKALATGGEFSVLVEESSGAGLSEHYAPCRVVGNAAVRVLVRVRPVGLEAGRVLAEPLEDA